MTSKERKKAFKAYLEEAYRPSLTSAENVFHMAKSLSVSLNRIHPEYRSVFELEDKNALMELLGYVRNPNAGKLAFGTKVENLDWKEAFIKHYDVFLGLEEAKKNATVQMSDSQEEKFLEGQLQETKFFRRKRNRALREECIKKYGGYKCYVCGFDFEKVYGERGKEFIEVHHLNPMASYDDEHPITPDELRPLCSNCHSMIHRDPSGGVTDIEVFKAEYIRQKH